MFKVKFCSWEMYTFWIEPISATLVLPTLQPNHCKTIVANTQPVQVLPFGYPDWGRTMPFVCCCPGMAFLVGFQTLVPIHVNVWQTVRFWCPGWHTMPDRCLRTAQRASLVCLWGVSLCLVHFWSRVFCLVYPKWNLFFAHTSCSVVQAYEGNYFKTSLLLWTHPVS